MWRIAVKRFPVHKSDDVASILAKTYRHQLILFYQIIKRMLAQKPLPTSPEKWSRRPFTRKELNALGQISPDMNKEEIAQRVRAAHFGIWKPTIRLHGFTFELKDEK